MLDSDTLRPVMIAMCLYLILAYLLPKALEKPTGVKIIDDLVTMLKNNKPFLASGCLMVGILVYVTNYIEQELVSE